MACLSGPPAPRARALPAQDAAAAAGLQQRVRELEARLADLAEEAARERALRQAAEKAVRRLEARLGIV